MSDDDKYFKLAARVAKKSTCLRGHCGSVIVNKSGQVIGEGYNSPPLNDEENRTCLEEYTATEKLRFDKTCCIHAEWRAIIDALKHQPKDISGSTLYFMRIDKNGEFTDAGKPSCTTCSRLALESGIKYFALWENGKPAVYDTKTYNRLSYDFHQPKI